MTEREKDSDEVENSTDEQATPETEGSSESESASEGGAEAEATVEDGAAASADVESDEEAESVAEASQEPAPVASASGGKSAGWLFAAAALVIGGAGGWFGHQAQTAKAVQAADAAVQGEGDGARGPCKDWEEKICGDLGEKAFACNQAKSASGLLPGSACDLALKAVPETLTKIHAARTSCNEMSTKLCKDLGADSPGCKMVEAQTPSFPPERCDEVAKNYDQVLAQLKQMSAGPPGMGGPRGGHAGMRRPGPGGPPGVRAPHGPGGPGSPSSIKAPAPAKVPAPAKAPVPGKSATTGGAPKKPAAAPPATP